MSSSKSLRSGKSSQSTSTGREKGSVNIVRDFKGRSYKVPISVLQKAIKEIYFEAPTMAESMSNENQHRIRCHQNTYEYFSTGETPNCNANFLEGAKQALEDKNFKVLYEILKKALKLRDNALNQQIQEYFYTALMYPDPLVKNSEEACKEYLQRIRLMSEEEAERFIANAHTLRKHNQGLDTREALDFDDLPEVRFQLFKADESESNET